MSEHGNPTGTRLCCAPIDHCDLRRRGAARARARRAWGSTVPPAVISGLLHAHHLGDGELSTLRPPFRSYALTTTGVRRAAFGVGAVLTRAQAADAAGLLIGISLEMAHRAAPFPDEDDRAAVRIAGVVEACLAWRERAGGAA